MTQQDDRLLPLVRALPRPVWVLMVGQFLNRFGTFVHVFLVVWMLDMGYSAQQAGLAVSAYGAGSLLAAIGGGQLADQFGRRETIVVSMFSSAATLLFLEQAATLPTVILGAVIFGFAGELYRPAASALLADITDDENRLVAFAGYRYAINLGFALGPAMAGFAAARSFSWLFWGDAATSIAFGLLAWFLLPGGKPEPAQEQTTESSWRVLARDRRFLLFVGAAFLNGLVFVQAFSTFAVHVKDAGFSDAQYGLLLSFNGLLIVAFELPIVKWARVRPGTPVMVIGMLLLGIGYGLISWAFTLAALAVTVTIWTMGEMVVAPVATAHVARISPAHLRGRYAGVIGLAFGVANVIAPAGGTFVYGLSPTALWTGCFILTVLASWLLVKSDQAGHEARQRLRRPAPA